MERSECARFFPQDDVLSVGTFERQSYKVTKYRDGDATDSAQGKFPVATNGCVDTQVTQLSSRKLWDVIFLVETQCCEVDREFLIEIKVELKRRGELRSTNPWKRPH